MRSLRRPLPLLAAGCLLSWACAQSPPADLSPYVDPTMPSVGSDKDPIPGKGSSGTSGSSGSSGTDETGETSSSSGGNTSSSSSSGSSKDAGTDTKPPQQQSSAKPAQGEIVISEVMYDATIGAEPGSEWIEIHNTTSSERSLSGLTIIDGASRTHTIGSNVTIAGGAYKLLVRSQAGASAAKIPLSAILYAYGTGLADNVGIQLANASTGGVSIKDGSTVIAQANYGGWFTQAGGSTVQLKTTTYAAAANKASWCLSATSWAAGTDKGTPGAPSDCP